MESFSNKESVYLQSHRCLCNLVDPNFHCRLTLAELLNSTGILYTVSEMQSSILTTIKNRKLRPKKRMTKTFNGEFSVIHWFQLSIGGVNRPFVILTRALANRWMLLDSLLTPFSPSLLLLVIDFCFCLLFDSLLLFCHLSLLHWDCQFASLKFSVIQNLLFRLWYSDPVIQTLAFEL